MVKIVKQSKFKCNLPTRIQQNMWRLSYMIKFLQNLIILLVNDFIISLLLAQWQRDSVWNSLGAQEAVFAPKQDTLQYVQTLRTRFSHCLPAKFSNSFYFTARFRWTTDRGSYIYNVTFGLERSYFFLTENNVYYIVLY